MHVVRFSNKLKWNIKESEIKQELFVPADEEFEELCFDFGLELDEVVSNICIIFVPCILHLLKKNSLFMSTIWNN